MSDHTISIVTKKSNYPDNVAKAKEILDWLISKDIVKSELSDCVLSSDKGYGISNGAKLITNKPEELPFFLVNNGLQIITDKTVFDSGEFAIEKCICPNCNQDISQEEWTFIDEWYSQNNDNSICPLCNLKFNIYDLKIVPEWGFSDLGFTFWNWTELNTGFLQEFKGKLNCDISVVYQHL